VSTQYSAEFGTSPTEYFWRVSAIDAGGNQGPWAGPNSFKVTLDVPTIPDKYPSCSAGAATPGWNTLVGLLIAGALLIRRRLRI